MRLKTFDKIKFLNIKYFVNLFNLQTKKRKGELMLSTLVIGGMLFILLSFFGYSYYQKNKIEE